MVRKAYREITSAANPLLKVFRHALAEGVTREGWVAVEGPFALEEALAASAISSIQFTVHGLQFTLRIENPLTVDYQP